MITDKIALCNMRHARARGIIPARKATVAERADQMRQMQNKIRTGVGTMPAVG